MLEHNCIISFSFGTDVKVTQYRHILVAGGKVYAFDTAMNHHEFAVTNTLEEMYQKYCHYKNFKIIEEYDMTILEKVEEKNE